MTIEIVSTELRYTADSLDWRVTLIPYDKPEQFIIIPILTGTLDYSSGVNLDNLAQLLIDARNDAVNNRGLNWNNWDQ